MSTIRERLIKAQQKKGIKGDSDLLRRVYRHLSNKEKKELNPKGKDENDFVNDFKASFFGMIEEKRPFSPALYLPLERTLGVSMNYLIEGAGDVPEEKEQRLTLYSAAKSDTRGNYEKLVQEGLHEWPDEYRNSLLDYMVEFGSGNGFDFFAERDELPLDDIGFHAYKGPFMETPETESIVSAMLSSCSLETARKYTNGFHFADAGISPASLSFQNQNRLFDIACSLYQREDLRRDHYGKKKVLSIEEANHLQPIGGKSAGDAAFVDYEFACMVNLLSRTMALTEKESFSRLIEEVFQQAMRINGEVMPIILAQEFKDYRIDNCGFVFSGRHLCGSIVVISDAIKEEWGPEEAKWMNKLTEQIVGFHDALAAKSQSFRQPGKLILEKRGTEQLCKFYSEMQANHVDALAKLDENYSENQIALALPQGEEQVASLGAIPSHNEAIALMAKIDALSEKLLGKGKIYAFPGLSPRWFYADKNGIKHFIPERVAIGERYDNLGAVLERVDLAIPYFNVNDNQLEGVFNALKTYGVKKSQAREVMEELKSYFLRNAESFDKTIKENKILIANANSRAMWCDLFAEDIEKLY